MEDLYLELGINIPILSSKYKVYQENLLTDSWVRYTWAFMLSHNTKLQDHTPTVPKSQFGDCILMEKFHSLKLIP